MSQVSQRVEHSGQGRRIDLQAARQLMQRQRLRAAVQRFQDGSQHGGSLWATDIGPISAEPDRQPQLINGDGPDPGHAGLIDG
jgi:hypothetical protein